MSIKKIKKQKNLPSVEIPSPLPNWLKDCHSPLIIQAKILANQERFKEAVILAKEDFKLNNSVQALDIICDCYVALMNKKGFGGALKKMEELNAPKGLIYLNKSVYSLICMKDKKEFKNLINKAETCLQDLPNECKADLYLFKGVCCSDYTEKISLFEKSLAYKDYISPQLAAVIHYEKSIAYINLGDGENAYKEADFSVNCWPEDWQGYYARALAGCMISNLDRFNEDVETVIKHKDAYEKIKKDVTNLQNALIEKLLHPKNAKVSLDENFYKKLKEIFIKYHGKLAEEFLTVTTFGQAEKILCAERLKFMFRESIRSAAAFGVKHLKPMLTKELSDDLETLENNFQTDKQKDLLVLFETVEELTCRLKNVMTEQIFKNKGQMIIMHSIMGLAIPDSFSSNLPNLRHLEGDTKADEHIQKLRAAIKEVMAKYMQMYQEFIYEFTMTAAKYNADISIPEK